MKALDPTSVVRSDEQASVENARGVPATIRNIYNKVLSGTVLTDKQIKEIGETAATLASTAIKESNTELDNYLATFENSLTPSQVAKFGAMKIEELPKAKAKAKAEPEPATPPAGFVPIPPADSNETYEQRRQRILQLPPG